MGKTAAERAREYRERRARGSSVGPASAPDLSSDTLRRLLDTVDRLADSNAELARALVGALRSGRLPVTNRDERCDERPSQSDVTASQSDERDASRVAFAGRARTHSDLDLSLVSLEKDSKKEQDTKTLEGPDPICAVPRASVTDRSSRTPSLTVTDGLTLEPVTAVVKREAKGTRASRLPEDWKPSPETIARFAKQGVDARGSLEVFSNYWLAKSGRDATKVDWERTYVNWVLSDIAKGTAKRLPPREWKPEKRAPGDEPASRAEAEAERLKVEAILSKMPKVPTLEEARSCAPRLSPSDLEKLRELDRSIGKGE